MGKENSPWPRKNSSLRANIKAIGVFLRGSVWSPETPTGGPFSVLILDPWCVAQILVRGPAMHTGWGLAERGVFSPPTDYSIPRYRQEVERKDVGGRCLVESQIVSFGMG